MKELNEAEEVRPYAILREPNGGRKCACEVGEIIDIMTDGEAGVTEEWGIQIAYMTEQQFEEMPEFEGF